MVMKKHHGFTLIETAIVLFILALVAGAGLSLATALRTNQGISTARTKQEAIKEALITFIARNQRLPCPAIETLAPGAGYGVESGGPGACVATAVAGGAVQRGVVPWVSLGLPDADALDGRNNRFSYFVVQAATATSTSVTPLSGMRGGIALHSGTPVVLGLPATGNQINACTTAGNGCNIAAVALILSHGSNGSSAFAPNGVRLPAPVGTAELELENTDTDASFVQTQYSDNVVNPFDDILLAMTPADLLGPLERNGSIQSALSITNERMTAIRDSVNLAIVDANGITPAGPPPLPTTPPNDGWGPLIAFAYNTPTVGPGTNVCALVGTPILIFTLTSTGLDPASAGDDITVTQDDVRIRTMINNKGIACP